MTMTGEEAERYLLSLELFGMRFGLERMRRLMTALDHPERAFASIHVVGTNGKSSTTRMIAAILHEHGQRTGAYLSPHLVSFGERIRIDDQDLTPAEFGSAVTHARAAAEKVDRHADADDHVTQFEALTAAAYFEMARRGVDTAVIEAGLGGRYDATNVIPSSVQVLTSVGLEHTRWLGPTVTDIAGEKLDVVRRSHPPATLVLGATVHPDAVAVAERVAAEREARIVRAPDDPGVDVGAPGAYQRRNFALARAAAEAFLGELDPAAVARAAATVRIPGRMQQVDTEPATFVDGAHNPDGIRAVIESLPDLVGAHGRVVAVVSILDDKDAAGMLSALGGSIDELVLTHAGNPRALSPGTLLSLARQVHGPDGEIVPDPRQALERARELAGPDGVVIATGALKLVGDLLADGAPRRISIL
jgi:dihydrofolate synthase/folylpolyglutamate synthase